MISNLCPHLNSNLADIKISVTKYAWDFIIINWGIEGSGKSKFSGYMAHNMDDGFSIRQTAISDEDISGTIDAAEKGQVVIVDEGGEYLFNRDWNKTKNKERIQDLFVIRQKGLIIIINVPDIKNLDVYVRGGRLRLGTKTWTVPRLLKEDDGTTRMHRDRGFFSLYSRKRIIDYFDKDYYLKPSFSERYPDIEEWKEGREYWKAYTDKKLKFLRDRESNKGTEKEKIEQVIKDARKQLRGLPEDRVWVDKAKANYLGTGL
jgi:hypothetical protein